LATLTYIRDHGIEALERDFHVKVVKSKDSLKIFTSYYAKEMANFEELSPIYKECFGGLCLRNTPEKDYRILALSFTAFDKITSNPRDCNLYEKLDGS
jgi:hypothetical protein